MDKDIRLWGSRRRSAPARPEFPELYPETDERHWYDLEYAGWGQAKAGLPPSPRDGPAGKRIACIHHLVGHPYMADYDRGMAREAERFGISLELLHSEWEPEAESELVAGFHAEYSGMKFGMFFVGEYIGITLISALAVTLFLGAWLGPVLPPLLWFVLKTGALICVFILLRATLPRPRYDQLISYGWKAMLPLALINIVVTGGIYLAARM